MANTAGEPPVGNRFRRFYSQITPIFQKPRMRASTAAVFSFLAVSLFLWYAVRPTAQTIIFLRREIVDKTELNQRMEDKITALIEAQANYENMQDRLPLIENALPHNPDAVILARELRNLAVVSQASISAIQIPSLPLIAQEATPGAKLATPKATEAFPITIIISGPYSALRTFLTGLLSLRRITTIDTISLKQESHSIIPGETLQLSIRLLSYYSTQ